LNWVYGLEGKKMNKTVIVMLFVAILSACTERLEESVSEIPPDDGESKDCYVTNSNFDVGVGMECYYYGGLDANYCNNARQRGDICSDNQTANRSNIRRR